MVAAMTFSLFQNWLVTLRISSYVAPGQKLKYSNKIKKASLVINQLEQAECPGATQELFNSFFERKWNIFTVWLIKLGKVIVLLCKETSKLGILILVMDSHHDTYTMSRRHTKYKSSNIISFIHVWHLKLAQS